MEVDIKLVESDGEWAAPSTLVNSMRTVGLLYPVLVTENGNGYQIVDGRRRLAAARELGWDTIEVRIVSGEVAFAVTGLAGNVHSSNPLSEARMLDSDRADEQQEAIGLSKGAIRARKRLLNLSPALQKMLERGEITLTMAKELVRLPEPAQEIAFSKVEGKPSLKAVRRAVREMHAKVNPQLPIELPNFESEMRVDGVGIAAQIRAFIGDSRLSFNDRDVLGQAMEILERC